MGHRGGHKLSSKDHAEEEKAKVIRAGKIGSSPAEERFCAHNISRKETGRKAVSEQNPI